MKERKKDSPFWSVMIPTYNPRPEHLEQALRSVLAQDPGPEEMQIEVVDDCSPSVDVSALVREIAGERVTFSRNEENLGLAGGWNRCISLARGSWVHILHQDDYVLPEFYERMMGAAQKHSDVQFIAARSFWVDADGIIDRATPRLPHLESGGTECSDFYYSNPLHCAGVAIHRDFYETHGGFRTDLTFALDSEMWVRAISRGGGVILPDVLAAYRYSTSGGNATAGLLRSAELYEDHVRQAKIFAQEQPDFDLSRARKGISASAVYRAKRAEASGDREAAKALFAFWKRNTTFLERARFRLGGVKRRLLG